MAAVGATDRESGRDDPEDTAGREAAGWEDDTIYTLYAVSGGGADGDIDGTARTGESRVFKTLHTQAGIPLRFLVDSGSDCDVISLNEYYRVTGDMALTGLRRAVAALRMYDGSYVRTVGVAQLRLVNQLTGRAVVIRCRVVPGYVLPTLSLRTSVSLGLIAVKDVDAPLTMTMFPGRGRAGSLKHSRPESRVWYPRPLHRGRGNCSIRGGVRY